MMSVVENILKGDEFFADTVDMETRMFTGCNKQIKNVLTRRKKTMFT